MPVSFRTQFLFSLSHFVNTGYFAFILIFSPLYAEALGFSAVQIGTINIAAMIATMLGGPLVLQIVGGSRTPARILKLSSILAVFAYLLLISTKTFNLFILYWTFFIAMRVASGTLIDVQLIKLSARGALRFEFIRTWGSIGFVFLGFFLGILFDRYDRISIVHYMTLYVTLQTGLCLYLAKELHPYEESSVRYTVKKVLSILADKKIIALFLSVSLIWLSHGPYYVYFSLYLQGIGWNSMQTSLAWNIATIGEILLFLFFRRIQLKISLTLLLSISFFITIIRWLLLANFENFYLILLSQTLHAFSFGACYLASIRLTYEWFPEGYKEKSQGLLTLFGVGIGSLGGRLLASYLAPYYSNYSEFSSMFYAGAIVALISLVISLLFFLKPKKMTSEDTVRLPIGEATV